MGNKTSSKETTPATDGSSNPNVKPSTAAAAPVSSALLAPAVNTTPATEPTHKQHSDRVLRLSPEYLNDGGPLLGEGGPDVRSYGDLGNKVVVGAQKGVKGKLNVEEGEFQGLGSSFDPQSWIKPTFVEEIEAPVEAEIPIYSRNRDVGSSSLDQTAQQPTSSRVHVIQNPELFSTVLSDQRLDPFLADSSPIRPLKNSALDSPQKLEGSASQYFPNGTMAFESQLRAPSPRNYRDVSSRLLTIKSKLGPVSLLQSKRNLMKPSSVKINLKKSDNLSPDIAELRAEGKVLESELPLQRALQPNNASAQPGTKAIVESVMIASPHLVQPLESTIRPVDLRKLHLLGQSEEGLMRSDHPQNLKRDIAMFDSIAELSSHNENTSQKLASKLDQPQQSANQPSSQPSLQRDDDMFIKQSHLAMSQADNHHVPVERRDGLPQSLLKSRNDKGFGESILYLSEKTKIELARVPESLNLGYNTRDITQRSLLDGFQIQTLEDSAKNGWQPKFEIVSSKMPAKLETVIAFQQTHQPYHKQRSPNRTSPASHPTDTLLLSVSRPSPKPRSPQAPIPLKPQTHSTQTPKKPSQPPKTPTTSTQTARPRTITPNLAVLADSLLKDPYICGL